MMENRYMEKLRRLTVASWKGEKVKVVLFGSRARQDHHRTSDVDIGLIPSSILDKKKLVRLKDAVGELNIPYKVEIVDLSQTSEEFKKEAMKGAVLWKDWSQYLSISTKLKLGPSLSPLRKKFKTGIELRHRDAVRALGTLQAIFKEPFSAIVRDAAIQRFEYTFEAFWKFIKETLKEKEGIVANSPKSCFKEVFSLGFADEEETVALQEMTDKRNETSHTYKEDVAQGIYQKLPEYGALMEKILGRMRGDGK